VLAPKVSLDRSSACVTFGDPNKDKQLHLLCAEGSAAFGALPTPIRQLGPWTGSKEGEVSSPRLAYRVMLGEQGFALIYEHVSKIELVQMMTECPQRKGKARVPMHHGLREKECTVRWSWVDQSGLSCRAILSSQELQNH
jgi:hypothetical protein